MMYDFLCTVLCEETWYAYAFYQLESMYSVPV